MSVRQETSTHDPSCGRSLRLLLTKVAHELDKSRTLLGRWSSRWGWAFRADQWDAHQDWLFQQELAEARQELARRHARVGAQAVATAVKRLVGVDGLVTPLDPSALTASEVSRLLEVGVKVERLALGAEEKVAISGPDGGPVQIEDASAAFMRDRLQLVWERVHSETQQEKVSRLRRELAAAEALESGNGHGNGHRALMEIPARSDEDS
jgi:hypothetical protein